MKVTLSFIQNGEPQTMEVVLKARPMKHDVINIFSETTVTSFLVTGVSHSVDVDTMESEEIVCTCDYTPPRLFNN